MTRLKNIKTRDFHMLNSLQTSIIVTFYNEDDSHPGWYSEVVLKFCLKTKVKNSCHKNCLIGIL